MQKSCHTLTPCWGEVGAQKKMAMKLLFGCFLSQQHASVSLGQTCSHNCRCNHTNAEDADQTCYLTQSQAISPSTDPVTPGAWQGSYKSTQFGVTGMTRPGKISMAKEETEPRSAAVKADALLRGQRGHRQ